MTDDAISGDESPRNDLPVKEYDTVDVTPTEKVENAAGGLAAFNSVLWEIAKTFGILTLMFMAIFFLFMAWQVAQWGMTTL